jgi:hypothetical protein
MSAPVAPTFWWASPWVVADRKVGAATAPWTAPRRSPATPTGRSALQRRHGQRRAKARRRRPEGRRYGSGPGLAKFARRIACSRTPHRPHAPAPWARTALLKEADYIVNCSFTELTRNNHGIRASDDAYGAINVNRIYQRGPDWVRPGDAAMGVIGLMAAAIQLRKLGVDTTRCDQMLDHFFREWLLTRQQAINRNPHHPDRGGFYQRVYYVPDGRYAKHDTTNSGVTGQMLAAMWKYDEYLRATGRPWSARRWLRQAWPLARDAGDFLRRSYDIPHHLMRSDTAGVDLWLSDSTYAAMALRCLDRWAATIRQPRPFDYRAVARRMSLAIWEMRDTGEKRDFFRYRDGHRAESPPTYGDRIDQVCFLPFEADVLDPGKRFARQISDWWTSGSEGIRMTYPAADARDWRYYGTHWWHVFAGPDENRRANNNLYPGPGLQLAKVEWKHARRTGDRVTMERARRRLEWARSQSYSALWLGATGSREADVPNGLVDWRNETHYKEKADDWARFVDTSAYFIEVVLMIEYGVDTKYVPN